MSADNALIRLMQDASFARSVEQLGRRGRGIPRGFAVD